MGNTWVQRKTMNFTLQRPMAKNPFLLFFSSSSSSSSLFSAILPLSHDECVFVCGRMEKGRERK
jgi:hypothetical protein